LTLSHCRIEGEIVLSLSGILLCIYVLLFIVLSILFYRFMKVKGLVLCLLYSFLGLLSAPVFLLGHLKFIILLAVIIVLTTLVSHRVKDPEIVVGLAPYYISLAFSIRILLTAFAETFIP